MMKIGRGSERGVALITVLWAVVILLIIVGSFATAMQREARMAANMVEAAELRHAARSAVRLGIRDLLQSASQPGPDQVDGRWHPVAFPGQQAYLSIRDERGKMDLNAAHGRLLTGLLAQVGLPDDRLLYVSDAIVDWRRGAGGRGLHGPAEDDYLAAGRGPRENRPFYSVSELQRVLGVDGELYARLYPLVTVHSHGAQPDPAYASLSVLAAMPGVSRENARAWLADRNYHREQGSEPPPFPGLGRSGTGRGSVYTLRSVVRGAGDKAAYYEMTVRLTGLEADPYQVLEARHAPPGTSYWDAPDAD